MICSCSRIYFLLIRDFCIIVIVLALEMIVTVSMIAGSLVIGHAQCKNVVIRTAHFRTLV